MPARFVVQIGVFAFVFTLLFGVFEAGILPEAKGIDVAVFVGFYSMVGFIFSVVSAFVIQVKWHVWDRLVEASHGEINALRQLHLLVRHLPLRLHGPIRERMKEYLNAVMYTGWRRGERPTLRASDDALMQLEDAIFSLEDAAKSSNSCDIGYDLLTKIMHFKEQRENYSRRKTPGVLKVFLFSAVLVIAFMSLLLPVVDVWMKYIFSLSIVLLAYTMYLMIDDLDHPYRAGGWHLSDKEYNLLLEQIQTY